MRNILPFSQRGCLNDSVGYYIRGNGGGREGAVKGKTWVWREGVGTS